MPEPAATKLALADAMKTLMTRQPLAKITVGDLCAHCGISRKGFYYHFKDKFDLVNWIFLTEYVLPAKDHPYDSLWTFFVEICTYFYENRPFYINAFAVEGQNSFADYFADLLRPEAIRYLDEYFEHSENHTFYANFFTDAFRLAIVRWLREDAQLQPEAFVSLLRGAVEGIARRIVTDTAE